MRSTRLVTPPGDADGLAEALLGVGSLLPTHEQLATDPLERIAEACGSGSSCAGCDGEASIAT